MGAALRPSLAATVSHHLEGLGKFTTTYVVSTQLVNFFCAQIVTILEMGKRSKKVADTGSVVEKAKRRRRQKMRAARQVCSITPKDVFALRERMVACPCQRVTIVCFQRGGTAQRVLLNGYLVLFCVVW